MKSRTSQVPKDGGVLPGHIVFLFRGGTCSHRIEVKSPCLGNLKIPITLLMLVVTFVTKTTCRDWGRPVRVHVYSHELSQVPKDGGVLPGHIVFLFKGGTCSRHLEVEAKALVITIFQLPFSEQLL
jgi:hypothetical protein